ncbi:MAG: hypothetical protein NZ874_00995 [Fimbriimonadales bacterium]|nr:hypothetical protein [Fimbriimonadales bacterium]
MRTKRRTKEPPVSQEPPSLPRKNSPQAWLLLAGTLTDEEAEAILEAVRTESRRVEPEMFEYKGLRKRRCALTPNPSPASRERGVKFPLPLRGGKG